MIMLKTKRTFIYDSDFFLKIKMILIKESEYISGHIDKKVEFLNHAVNVKKEVENNYFSFDYYARSLAILHDVGEDCWKYSKYDTPEEYVNSFDIPDELRTDILCLTRRDGESYNNYIDRVFQTGTKTAKVVKICDVMVNLRRSLYGPTSDALKAKKYSGVLNRISKKHMPLVKEDENE